MSYAIPYFLSLDDCSSFTLGQLAEAIARTPKRRIADITLGELCSVSDYPHGLYLIFDDDDSLCYVGKATSRSFIERIPAHFDVREGAWFNTIPKRVMKFHDISNYTDALQRGISLRILLIGIRDAGTTSRLERVLRSFLKPRFNTGKTEFYGTDTLAELRLP